MNPPAAALRVRYTRRGPVVVLSIDHPPVNVLSADVLEELQGALARAAADRGARVVVLEGTINRAFAAGADIREMAPMGPEEAHVHGSRGQAVTTAIERLPLPVIAAVHGACVGGGCEIALACDFIVASDDARFGQPEINLGVMPGWGGTRRLPRRIGAARARTWILTGRTVTAQQAHEQGLVHAVVPKTDLRSTAMALAEELATKPATALAAAKFALNRAIDPSNREGLAYELQLWSQLFGTPDQREGMAAFLEKRAAKFEPRPEWGTMAERFPIEPGSTAQSTAGGSKEKRKN